MPDPKSNQPRPDLHKHIPASEADKNCGTEHGFVGITCEHCAGRYIIHCERCVQQVTHCNCTMPKLIEKAVKEAEEEEEKRPWLEKQGVWLPPSARNN